MRGVVDHLHVQHRRQATETLRTDAECIHLFVEFDAQFFQRIGRAALEQLVHIERLHQRFFCHEHGLLGGAADTNAEHAGRAPAGAHGRHGLQHPLHNAVRRVQHDELRFVFGPATLGRYRHLDVAARHQFRMNDCRRVVFGVAAAERRIGNDRGAQFVVRVVVGATNTFVNQLVERQARIPTHVHAHLQEHVDDAGVLADGAAPFSAHAGVRQDLRDGVFGRRRLLALVGARQVLEIVRRVVIGNELQRIGDALHEIGFTDDGHGGLQLRQSVDRAWTRGGRPARRAPKGPMMEPASGLRRDGADTVTRTRDLLITNQLLYQLSYVGAQSRRGSIGEATLPAKTTYG